MLRRRFPRHEGRLRGASRVRPLGERNAGDLRSGGPTALLGRGPMASQRAYAGLPPARSRPSRRLRRWWPRCSRATPRACFAGGTRRRGNRSVRNPCEPRQGSPPSRSAPTAARWWPEATTGRSSAGTCRAGRSSARPCLTARPSARLPSSGAAGGSSWRPGTSQSASGTRRHWGVSALPPEGATVTSLAISPDGDRFATGTEGGTVRLWDSSTLRQSGQTFKLVGTVRCLAFRPDGRALAIGLEDGTIPVWEVPRSGPIDPPRLTRRPVRAVAFGRDGGHLLAVGGRGPERWGLGRRARADSPGARSAGPGTPTGCPTDARAVSGHVGQPGRAADRHGRRRAVAGGSRVRVRLLDAETGAVVGEWP